MTFLALSLYISQAPAKSPPLKRSKVVCAASFAPSMVFGSAPPAPPPAPAAAPPLVASASESSEQPADRDTTAAASMATALRRRIGWVSLMPGIKGQDHQT